MFNHKDIEKKWQNIWEKEDSFRTDINSTKEKIYVLDMFPYPSGAGLHVGHPEGYTATDIFARMKKMQGYEILHPIGFDAFGLPAEQYAIKTGNSPASFTNENIDNFKKQLKSLGFSFDWSREVVTTDEEYYKITQWIFIQLYKNDLAELKELEVNWSNSLNTVLSNEEVLLDENNNPVSERDGLPVVKKMMKQWVLKITKYADKLFEGLENLDWPEGLKKLQKNWIYETDENGEYTKELHLRDWLFARQRYWGEPFPIVHQDNGEIYLIPDNQLPVKLPTINDYSFSQDGLPALAKAKDWINFNENGITGKRDLNTMPQWAGSSWYFIAYILKEGEGYLDITSPEAKKRMNKWLPVDLYIGGQEHAVLHLLYARFWNMFLKDIGIHDRPEPFLKLFNQGMILGPDGSKMSKSKGNVINPDKIINEFGADTLRVYEMFMGALDDDKPWSENGVKSTRDWLDRVYRTFTKNIVIENSSDSTKIKFNTLLSKASSNIENLKFNLLVSEMMVFINHLNKAKEASVEVVLGFLKILSTIAPHIAEEINSKIIKGSKTLATSKWPTKIDVIEFEKEYIYIISVNGKVRAEIKGEKLSSNPSDSELIRFSEKHAPKHVNSSEVKKVIFIKNKIINIVI